MGRLRSRAKLSAFARDPGGLAPLNKQKAMPCDARGQELTLLLHKCLARMPQMSYGIVVKGTLTIRLDEDLARALQAEALQSGIAKGEIVRQAIQARLRPKRKASVMQRYFGVMQGPADLSTNKAYRRTWSKKRR